MQTHGGTEAEKAITAAERRFQVEVQVDWDGDGTYDHYLTNMTRYVESVSTDRALKGSAPEEVMLIEGSSAAELTMVVSGEDPFRKINLTSVFSPYNGLSPLYSLEPIGCEVKYRLGVETAIGVIWYPQFIGNVRTITPNVGSNSVTITALDRAEKLRMPIKFQTWSLHSYWSQRGWTVAQLCRSHWVIDHCLRAAGVSPSPYVPQRDYHHTLPNEINPDFDPRGNQFFLSGNGSYVPSLGWMDSSRRQGYPKTESGGPEMYERVGKPHPDSPNPEQPPFALAAMGSDASGAKGSFDSGLDPYTSLTNSAEVRYWAQDREAVARLATHWIGFTLNTAGTNGEWFRTTGNTSYLLDVFLSDNWFIRIVTSNGSIRAEIRNRIGTPPYTGIVSDWKTIPAGDHVQVDVKIQTRSPESFVLMTLNEEPATWENIGAPPPAGSSFDNHKGLIILRHHSALSDVYWSQRFTYNGSSDPSTAEHGRVPAEYTAVLDEGLNRLTHLPATVFEDAWKVITDVAAAEYGSAFWDEQGVFRFWNRETLLGNQQSIARTLTLDEVEGLQITNSLDSVRNIITASSARVTSDESLVFESTDADEFYTPGNEFLPAIRIYKDGIQSVNPNELVRYSSTPGTYPVWNDNVTHGYVLEFFNGTSWAENDAVSSQRLNVRLDENGNLLFTTNDGYSQPWRFAAGGAPALRVAGTLQYPTDPAILKTQDAASIAKYGQRNLPLEGEWVQWQPDNITRLVDLVLPRSVRPIPTTDAITVAGDPRIQLGDTLEILDPDGLGEEMRVQVYGIKRTYSLTDGLTDVLTVEMIRPPQVGIWDSPQYGLWDSTFIWSD